MGTIYWKGTLSKQITDRPQVDELATYFENLYKSEDKNEIIEIEELVSRTYIPILVYPIKLLEIDGAAKDMKKGGYDYKLSL